MLNGAYGPALLCVSQFVASAPYIFVTAFIYQSIFHWLVRCRGGGGREALVERRERDNRIHETKNVKGFPSKALCHRNRQPFSARVPSRENHESTRKANHVRGLRSPLRPLNLCTLCRAGVAYENIFPHENYTTFPDLAGKRPLNPPSSIMYLSLYVSLCTRVCSAAPLVGRQVGFNDSVSAYSYAVILSASLLFMMEAIMLMVSCYLHTQPLQMTSAKIPNLSGADATGVRSAQAMSICVYI